MRTDEVHKGQTWRVGGRAARTVHVCTEPEGLFVKVRNVDTGAHSWMHTSTLRSRYELLSEPEEQR